MIGDRVPDKRIIQKVNQRLGRAGVAQCKITVNVRNGYVTLSGTIQYETQRRSLLNAARGVEGVRSVVDELTVRPKTKKWA
ncbi:MAG: BON domain-containing protein [Thermoguttaceae bacterium]|jgi:osmotically-inducible protein OsmY|nr:BON domain-containing protein [Thermoguttaceae bacterium]